MRVIFGVGLLLASAGCSTLLGPGRFSFSATKPGFSSPSEFARVTGVADAQIQFAGAISTPTPCYHVTGAGNVADREITITVSAASTLRAGQVCAQVVGSSSYTGVVRELESGSYRVVVTHAIPGTGWPTRTVADTSVILP
jgi:hypothetical protein